MDVWRRRSGQLWDGLPVAHPLHPLLLRVLVQAHLQGLQVSWLHSEHAQRFTSAVLLNCIKSDVFFCSLYAGPTAHSTLWLSSSSSWPRWWSVLSRLSAFQAGECGKHFDMKRKYSSIKLHHTCFSGPLHRFFKSKHHYSKIYQLIWIFDDHGEECCLKKYQNLLQVFSCVKI